MFRPFWGPDPLAIHNLLGWPFLAGKVAINCLEWINWENLGRSNLKFTWAMKKTLVVWCILGIILPSYGGHYSKPLFGFLLNNQDSMERTSFHRLFLDEDPWNLIPYIYRACVDFVENVSVHLVGKTKGIPIPSMGLVYLPTFGCF